MSEEPGVASRISTSVYASLTLLAVSVAATAKGYVGSSGEFAFLVLVSAFGLAVAHYWSNVLAKRLASSDPIDRHWLREEASSSSLMLIPGVIMVLLELVASLVVDDESSITIGMLGLLVMLFIYTWMVVRRRRQSTLSALYWALGTAAVGVLMMVFKVVA